MDRDSAIALLEEEHTFPGPFLFRVVVRPEHRDVITEAVRSTAASPEALLGVDERPSAKGKYVSLHLRTQVQGAAEVVDIYQALHTMEEVVLTL